MSINSERYPAHSNIIFWRDMLPYLLPASTGGNGAISLYPGAEARVELLWWFDHVPFLVRA